MAGTSVSSPEKVGAAYACDQCGADLSRFIRTRSSHAGPAIGQEKRVCRCGHEYSTGRVEWDNLSTEQRHSILKRTLFGCLFFFGILAFAGALGRGVQGYGISIDKAAGGCIEGLLGGWAFSVVLWFLLYLNVRSSLRRTRRPGGN